MAEMFWKIPDLSIQSPLVIIREQGSLLTDATGSELVGVTSSRYERPRNAIYLDIIVPNLKSHKINVLNYTYDINNYPGSLTANLSQKGYIINNQDDLLAALKEYLGSYEMQGILSSVYSQAMAQELAPQHKAISSRGCFSDACV